MQPASHPFLQIPHQKHPRKPGCHNNYYLHQSAAVLPVYSSLRYTDLPVHCCNMHSDNTHYCMRYSVHLHHTFPGHLLHMYNSASAVYYTYSVMLSYSAASGSMLCSVPVRMYPEHYCSRL